MRREDLAGRSEADPLFSVAGKNVLVTGGSRGIGYMIAAGLLERGARVMISARKAGALAQAASALRELGDCETVVADLARVEGIEALASAARRSFDRLDVLVNNAGAAWGDPVEQFRVEGWDKVMDTNVRAPFLLSSRLLDLLRAAASPEEPARIIQIGSMRGIAPQPDIENYSYTASKAAVHMLTRHLAGRLAREHITVNALAPGWFDSAMTAHLLDDGPTRERFAAEVPMGRIGAEQDIVGAIVFLASRAGAYLTAAIVPVDGGMSGC